MKAESQPITLAARLDMKSAPALQTQLLESLGAGAVIDAGEVTYVDTSALQVLCAFVTASARLGAQVTFTRVTPALDEGAARLGLQTHLGLNKTSI